VAVELTERRKAGRATHLLRTCSEGDVDGSRKKREKVKGGPIIWGSMRQCKKGPQRRTSEAGLVEKGEIVGVLPIVKADKYVMLWGEKIFGGTGGRRKPRGKKLGKKRGRKKKSQRTEKGEKTVHLSNHLSNESNQWGRERC